MSGAIVDVNLAVLAAVSWRTVTFVSELIQRRAPSIMKTGRRLTRNILRITVSSRIPRFTNARIRAVGVEASTVVTWTRATRAFDNVFRASRASKSRWTDAGVASRGRVVSYTASSVTAWLRCTMVFVRAFDTCVSRRAITLVGLNRGEPTRGSIKARRRVACCWYSDLA